MPEELWAPKAVAVFRHDPRRHDPKSSSGSGSSRIGRAQFEIVKLELFQYAGHPIYSSRGLIKRKTAMVEPAYMVSTIEQENF
jgi:hypothetical protein